MKVIHYHGTPLSGQSEQTAKFLRGRHALVPFPYQRDLPIVAAVCQSFCFDNGAFTAWKKGEPVADWQPYFDWVQEWCQHPAFDFAIIPDVIDGSEEANDQLIEEAVAGVSVLHIHSVLAPVWHLHESLERIKRLALEWPRRSRQPGRILES